MAKLTSDQIQFLDRLGVPLDKTFDATGRSRSYYSKIMEERSLEVAYGVTPCAKGNHTLRTRSGNCIQCNTANLRFQNRHIESGFLYLATSKLGGVIKFGVTQNISNRRLSLIETEYGGFSDWKIVLYSKVTEAGKIEKLIHSEISHLRVYSEYYKDGKMQSAYEIFKLPLKRATIIFKKYTE